MADAAGMTVLLVCALIVLRGTVKGVDVYGAFVHGAASGAKTGAALLPPLCAMVVMLTAARASGLLTILGGYLAPVLRLFRLPEETAGVLLLRPFSGSGSLAALEEVFARCGADSRAGRIASVLVGSSETIFYTMTVYLGAAKVRRLPWVVPVSLASYLIGAAVTGALIR